MLLPYFLVHTTVKAIIAAASTLKSQDNTMMVKIDRVRRFFTREEKSWVQQSFIIWNISTICLIISLRFGLFVFFTMIIMSYMDGHPPLLKGYVICLLINTLICLAHMLIFTQVDVCKEDKGIYDPSFTS